MKKPRMPRAAFEKSEVDYLNKLSEAEREWLLKFNHDFYAGGVYSKDTLLTSDEMKKEARHNHNSLSRDAMDVALTRGALADLDDETKEFMEEACDAWEYEREYKENGYKAGMMLIYEHAVRDLQNRLVDVRITLTRFYEKMNRLRRIYRNDRARKSK